jgi:hypothetical protein
MIRVRFVAAADDPEKLVLPGIVYASGSIPPSAGRDYTTRGFSLSFGWWHWCVSIFFGWNERQARPTTQSEEAGE